jgi:hypothetical protein
MSSLLILIAIISTSFASAATPKFGPNEDINWLIDMRKEYPIGIVCSKLFVVQVNGRSSQRLSAHQPRDTPGNYASEEAFLGNRFLVTIPAAVLANENYQLRLDCEPEPNANPIPLAKSSRFSIKGNNRNSQPSHSFEYWLKDAPVSSFSGEQIILRDISPTALNESPFQSCPISFDSTKETVLVNNLIREAGEFGKYLAVNRGKMVDSFNRPIDAVHRVNPAAIKHREKFLQQHQALNNDSEMPAIDLESVEAQNEQLLKTVNLNTDAVDSRALPILEELWSAKAVEDQMTAASRDIHRNFRMKVLRKTMLIAAAQLSSFPLVNSLNTARIHYFGSPLLLRLLPRLGSYIRSKPIGVFLNNAESDKTIQEKLKVALKFSVCVGLPLYATQAVLNYYVNTVSLRFVKKEKEAEEHRRIKMASLKQLTERLP